MRKESESFALDYPIVCHAEIDLSHWVGDLTGQSNWDFWGEHESEHCQSYLLRRGQEEAEVVIYNTGHVEVSVNDELRYEGAMPSQTEYVRLYYYHADSGEPILLN